MCCISQSDKIIFEGAFLFSYTCIFTRHFVNYCCNRSVSDTLRFCETIEEQSKLVLWNAKESQAEFDVSRLFHPILKIKWKLKFISCPWLLQNISSKLICSFLKKVPYNTYQFNISNMGRKGHPCQIQLGSLDHFRVPIKG